MSVTCDSLPQLFLLLREHAARPQNIEGEYHQQRDRIARFIEVVFTVPLVPSVRAFGFKLRTPNRSPRIVAKKWKVPAQVLDEAPKGALAELQEVLP